MNPVDVVRTPVVKEGREAFAAISNKISAFLDSTIREACAKYYEDEPVTTIVYEDLSTIIDNMMSDSKRDYICLFTFTVATVDRKITIEINLPLSTSSPLLDYKTIVRSEVYEGTSDIEVRLNTANTTVHLPSVRSITSRSTIKIPGYVTFPEVKGTVSDSLLEIWKQIIFSAIFTGRSHKYLLLGFETTKESMVQVLTALV